MSIAEIQKAVAERYCVSAGEMFGGSGEPRIKRPRQVAMYLARKYTTASLPEIATAFQKTVATVVKETRDIDAHIGLDSALEAEIEDLRKRLVLDREPVASHLTGTVAETCNISSETEDTPENVEKGRPERVGVEIVSKTDEVTIKISIR